MSRFWWILVACVMLATAICPIIAEAYVAYSPAYSGSYGGSSYHVAYSQPISCYSGLLSPNRSAPARIPVPAPTPTPNPIPPTPSPDPTSQLPNPAPIEPSGLTGDEQLLLNLVNAERAKHGLPGLAVDSRLVRLARLKSQDMLDLGYFAHSSPTYGGFGDMLKNEEIKFYLAAENIGMGGSITRIFNAFMASPGHRSKILDARYTHTGIGIVYRQGQGYRTTHLFLKPR